MPIIENEIIPNAGLSAMAELNGIMNGAIARAAKPQPEPQPSKPQGPWSWAQNKSATMEFLMEGEKTVATRVIDDSDEAARTGRILEMAPVMHKMIYNVAGFTEEQSDALLDYIEYGENTPQREAQECAEREQQEYSSLDRDDARAHGYVQRGNMAVKSL